MEWIPVIWFLDLIAFVSEAIVAAIAWCQCIVLDFLEKLKITVERRATILMVLIAQIQIRFQFHLFYADESISFYNDMDFKENQISVNQNYSDRVK